MTNIAPHSDPPADTPSDISVIICTYNRAEMLRDTLESWLSIQNAGTSVELIIVDNNSTDHTRLVVESFRPDCPCQLHYVCETDAGLSYARNRGITKASGNIVAFVDDDVYFDKCWLTALVKVFNDNPEISCAGGRSIPKFDGDKPDWITEDILKIYGATGYGDKDRLMVFPEYPFGLNMAFRKAVFTQLGKFNTRLGRVKKSLLSNEERDIFYRIHKAGLKVYYASEAVLYHRIFRDRMDKRWIAKRFYWQGVSDVVFDQLVQPRSKFMLFMKTGWILIKMILPAGRLTPRIVCLYNNSIPLNDKLETHRLLGIVKQNIAEIFTSSSSRSIN
jgi:glucosyl-dolichyl phosphate glucuronosyltransferase